MGRKVKTLKNYNAEQIKELTDNDSGYKQGVRLYAVYQLAKGKSSRMLEDLYNVSFKQICNWADRFDANGIAGLKDKVRSGRPSRLTAEQKEIIRGALTENPEIYGYNSATWSGALLIDFIGKRFSIFYKPSSAYVIFRKLGFSFQRARGLYPERDEVKRKEAKRDIKKL